MSNSKDWFQKIYLKNEEAINKLLKVASKENVTLRLSVYPDGEINFTANNDEVLRTLHRSSNSIKYFQYDLKEKQQKND